MTERKRARHHMAVSDDDMATYTAARAFLFGEWIGALLMVASFTQLYFLVIAVPIFGVGWPLTIGLGSLALGGWMFWTNRTYFLRLNLDWRRKWEVVATILAGTGVVFWLLFGLLALLVWNGIPIQN